ncbi:imm11 family protein [Brevifollis gellanilyticus]|nr:DUF1629 domain-containing protein [Brevifollis gellanilyticus]
MKYYQFTPLIGKYAQLRFKEGIETTSLFEVGTRVSQASLEAVEWSEFGDSQLHDCPIMNYGIFAFSEKAWSVLGDLLSRDVQAVRLTNISPRCYAINVLSLIPALDEQRSKCTFFRNGKVDRVLDYVFRPDLVEGRHMFRIPQRRCDTFVSEQLLDTAIGAGLKGFIKTKPVVQV